MSFDLAISPVHALMALERLAPLAGAIQWLAKQSTIERVYLLPAGRAIPRAEEEPLELLIIVDDCALPPWRETGRPTALLDGISANLHVLGCTDFQSTLQLERSLATRAVEDGTVLYARSSALRG